jgi:hypothetical protein
MSYEVNIPLPELPGFVIPSGTQKESSLVPQNLKTELFDLYDEVVESEFEETKCKEFKTMLQNFEGEELRSKVLKIYRQGIFNNYDTIVTFLLNIDKFKCCYKDPKDPKSYDKTLSDKIELLFKQSNVSNYLQEIIEIFIEKGLDIDTDGQRGTIFELACIYTCYDLITFFIKNKERFRLDINYGPQYRPLNLLICNDPIEKKDAQEFIRFKDCVELFLEHGAIVGSIERDEDKILDNLFYWYDKEYSNQFITILKLLISHILLNEGKVLRIFEKEDHDKIKKGIYPENYDEKLITFIKNLMNSQGIVLKPITWDDESSDDE